MSITACRRMPTAGPTFAPNSAQRAASTLRYIASRLKKSLGKASKKKRALRATDDCSPTDVDVIALAHHADDQAETLLLQLLRGAGAGRARRDAGISRRSSARAALLRPLLELTRAHLVAYAKLHSLEWIDDESNAQPKYRRNLLRTTLRRCSPRIFPDTPTRSTRAAAHQAEAALLLDELAALDAAGAIDDERWLRKSTATTHFAVASASAQSAALVSTPAGLRAPSTARLAEMLRQLQTATADARLSHRSRRAEIGCQRGRVVVHAARLSQPMTDRGAVKTPCSLPGGMLRFTPAVGAGIAVAALKSGQCLRCDPAPEANAPARREPTPARRQEVAVRRAAFRSGNARACRSSGAATNWSQCRALASRIAFRAGEHDRRLGYELGTRLQRRRNPGCPYG